MFAPFRRVRSIPGPAELGEQTPAAVAGVEGEQVVELVLFANAVRGRVVRISGDLRGAEGDAHLEHAVTAVHLVDLGISGEEVAPRVVGQGAYVTSELGDQDLVRI